MYKIDAMKKTLLFSVVCTLISVGVADAITPWWQHDTICRLSPSKCYSAMGAGYAPDDWDITSNCWGKKKICVDALTTKYITDHNTTEPVALGRTEIADSKNVNSDFDTTVLNGDCFGTRKSQSGGAMVSVNGQYVKVWCNGILTNPDDEYLANGEITTGAQPTCSELADDGYVGIQNGKCYGKYYDTSEYSIQCDGETPTLIILNGADPEGNAGTTDVTTRDDANALFATMFNNAKTQREKHSGE